MSDFRTITPSFSASPQITRDDVAVAAGLGFKAVICNRPDNEDSGQLNASEIETLCAAHGMTFTHIPVSGGMNQLQVDQMSTALEATDGPILAYCRSGTRSTNLWAMAMASGATGGENPDALVSAAAAAGYDLGGLLPSLRALASRN
jgi:uncharacterized protein (TIGR01244 family)